MQQTIVLLSKDYTTSDGGNVSNHAIKTFLKEFGTFISAYVQKKGMKLNIVDEKQFLWVYTYTHTQTQKKNYNWISFQHVIVFDDSIILLLPDGSHKCLKRTNKNFKEDCFQLIWMWCNNG